MKDIHSDLLPDKALIACWKILDRLEVGDRIRVADFAPKKPDVFIACCKKYYDCFRNLRFSNDYSEIKKIEKDLTFKEQLEKFK
jgi:hypothetical protein